MTELFMFMDESGDLGKLGHRYFVIGVLCTVNPKPIYNCIKRIRQRKLKNKLKELSEIKANNSSNPIRKKVLNDLMKLDCEFHIILVDKTMVRSYLFDKKNKLYNYIAGLLMDHIPMKYKKINLIIDKKDTNAFLRNDFDSYLKEYKTPWNKQIEIKHLESHQNRGLQAVDFIAWSVHRKFNLNDDSFLEIIKPKIRTQKELWK